MGQAGESLPQPERSEVILYRVTTLFTGTPAVGGGINQFYFAETAGSAAQAHAAVASFWAGVKTQMSSALTYTVAGEIELFDAATGQITGLATTDAVTSVGTQAGDMLPPATQGLVRWRTGFFANGRELRGRTFLPGMVEGSNLNGAPASTVVTALSGYAASLVSGTNHQLSVYSRAHASAAPVTSSSVWTKWAQLRSRRD